MKKNILKAWDDEITKRIGKRIVRNIKGEKGHRTHPELLLPKPAYMIVVDVKKIVDLTPKRLK